MQNRYLIGGAAALALALGVPALTRAVPTGATKLLADKEEKDGKEQKVELKDLPAAVTDAVKKDMPHGKITEAEREKKDGKTVYSLDVVVDGKTYDVEVSEDGKILKKEEDKDEAEKAKK